MKNADKFIGGFQRFNHALMQETPIKVSAIFKTPINCRIIGILSAFCMKNVHKIIILVENVVINKSAKKTIVIKDLYPKILNLDEKSKELTKLS